MKGLITYRVSNTAKVLQMVDTEEEHFYEEDRALWCTDSTEEEMEDALHFFDDVKTHIIIKEEVIMPNLLRFDVVEVNGEKVLNVSEDGIVLMSIKKDGEDGWDINMVRDIEIDHILISLTEALERL